MKWKTTVVNTINKVRLVCVLGYLNYDSWFISCLNVNAIYTIKKRMTFVTMKFHG